MGLPPILKSLPVTMSTVVVFTVATIAQVGTADPPVAAPGSLAWVVTPPNPWLLLTAALAGLGAIASLYQLFGPKPATPGDIGKDGRRTRQGLEHVSKQVALEGTASEQRDGELLTEIRAIQAQLRAEGNVGEQRIQSFVTAADELARSQDQFDRSIAHEIAQGDPILAADRLLESVADSKIHNAERARQAARIYGPFAPSKAMQAYKEAVDLDPTDVGSWIELGRLRADFVSLDAARRCFEIALQYEQDDRNRVVVECELGDLSYAARDFEEARRRYEAIHAILKRLAAEKPEDLICQRDLSVSHERLADLALKLGQLDAARTHCEASRSFFAGVAARYPNDPAWQRSLSVSLQKFGNLEVAAKDFDQARIYYTDSLTISEQLSRLEPNNTQWKRDEAVGHTKLGHVELAVENTEAARYHYERDLEISEELVTLEPDNAGWQRDLFVTQARLGQLAVMEENLSSAIAHFARAEATISALVDKRPDHPGFRRDLEHVRGDLESLRSIEEAFGRGREPDASTNS